MWAKSKAKPDEDDDVSDHHLRWIDRIPTAIEYSSSSSVESWNQQADETKSMRYSVEDAWSKGEGITSWDTKEHNGDDDICRGHSEEYEQDIPDKYSVVMDDDISSSSSSLESWNDSTFVSDTQFGLEIQQERERLKQLYEQQGKNTVTTMKSFFPFANCFNPGETQTQNLLDNEKIAHFRQITSDSFLQLE